ncbi:MAG TPA: hypothetical protein DCE41_17530 [Cytophagales bacterium]|nr:hypothetical protein [Cytophagales bacterium]HAA23866.1 hypothetical protein [Cytophagales bacterium]HAP64452.1 hypothetical protein [Cytophagales bacterium]
MIRYQASEKKRCQAFAVWQHTMSFSIGSNDQETNVKGMGTDIKPKGTVTKGGVWGSDDLVIGSYF